MIPLRSLPARPLILAGVAVSALLIGAGAAVAATSGSQAPGHTAVSRTPAGQAAATPRPMFPHGRHLRFLGPLGAGAPFGALHGQFVVPKPGGGYQTVDMQRGKVTAVSTDSITVQSQDGFTKTYQVTSSANVDAQRDGIGSVKTGQQVAVLATVSGTTATAKRIIDFSALPFGHVMPGRGFPGWKELPGRNMPMLPG